ncbi:MAG: hypothetical protein V7645_283 [Actinomycetota bacterium]|jgi:hypothetical protein
MSSILARALKVGFALSAVVGITALAVSGARSILLQIYFLGMGGVLLLALVRTTREGGATAGTSDFDRALLEMSRRPSDSGELTLVRDVEQSTRSALHLHVRLRPILREVAAHRLWMRFGVDLDRDHERARELVGANAWELVRPDRLPPSDRLARGPAPADLRVVVEELERL